MPSQEFVIVALAQSRKEDVFSRLGEWSGCETTLWVALSFELGLFMFLVVRSLATDERLASRQTEPDRQTQRQRQRQTETETQVETEAEEETEWECA